MRRNQLLTLVILVSASIFVAGCADKSTTAPAPQPQTTTSEAEPPALPADQAKAEVEEEAETESAEAEIVDAPKPQEPSTAPQLPERFVVFARGGPLILDVLLTVDGEPYDAAITALVDRVIQAGDTNGDGRATWAEWRENEEFLQGDLVNMASINARQLNNWVERYDENEDERIQRGEAAAWLGRNGGRSATSLRVRSSRSFRALGGLHSRLWQVVDADDDGQLSSNELQQAASRLFLLDTDDDRVVDNSELLSLRDQLNSANNRTNRFSRQTKRDAVMHLRDRRDARELDYVLSDLYAPRQYLSPESFPARRRLFEELDADEDQTLDAQELEAICDVEPHARLAVNFHADSEDTIPGGELTVIEQAAEIVAVVTPSSSEATLITSDMQLVMIADDRSSNQQDQSLVTSAQLSLMVHDRVDGLFQALDIDANGRLGEREIATVAARIREFDEDGDGRLQADELPYSMIVAFSRGGAANERSFYVPRVPILSTITNGQQNWFVHADLNGDGDVSRREFLGSADQFAALDTSGDGFVSADEAAAANAD